MKSATTKIDQAERCYEAGDFRSARRLATEVLSVEGGGKEESRARKLLKATGIDPAAVGVFVLTLGLFVFLIVHYVI